MEFNHSNNCSTHAADSHQTSDKIGISCEKTSQPPLANILKSLFFYFINMQHIQGIYRNQLQMGSLEEKISADNPVCFIFIPFWEQPLH